MKTTIFLISLLLASTWTQSCDDKFPGHTKAPAINHSNPGNQPSLTTCRKDRNDQYNLCRCFDTSGAEVMEDRKALATLFCCQCPETMDEAYSGFKDISFGTGNKFSFDTALEVHVERCPKISIKSMPKVETLQIKNSKETNFPSRFNLPNLKLLSILGRSKPTKYDQDIGTTLAMAEGNLGSKASNTELTMKNSRIAKLPKQLTLKSLTIDTSLFSNVEDLTFPDINSSDIDDLKITNSDILSIFKLGMSNHAKPFTFSKNKIHSTCETSADAQTCFLTPSIGAVYDSNTIQCSCSNQDGAECRQKDKAITKFQCSEKVLKNTVCSDLQEEEITLEYLETNNIGESCSDFEYDLEVLKLNINQDEDPNIPSNNSQIWVPIFLGIVAVGIIIISVFFIIRIRNAKPKRKASIYRPVKEDLAAEGEPVEDDDWSFSM